MRFSWMLFLLYACSAFAETSPQLIWALEAVKNQEWHSAIEQLRPLAQAGESEAQFQLGYLYRNGYGIEKNFATSAEWYRKAATQGHVRAQNNLAISLELGRGIERDLGLAAKWYRQAAEQDHGGAQKWMAFATGKGVGVQQDLPSSWVWHHLALEHDTECGRLQSSLAKVEPQLTESQRAESQRRLNQWRQQGRNGPP